MDTLSPIQLQEKIKEFAELWPEFADPLFARGKCVDVTMTFLDFIGVRTEYFNIYMRHNHDGDQYRWHAWACVNGLNIDFTARQFDHNAPFPKVWPEEK